MRSLGACGTIETLSELKALNFRLLEASCIDVTLTRVQMGKQNKEETQIVDQRVPGVYFPRD